MIDILGSTLTVSFVTLVSALRMECEVHVTSLEKEHQSVSLGYSCWLHLFCGEGGTHGTQKMQLYIRKSSIFYKRCLWHRGWQTTAHTSGLPWGKWLKKPCRWNIPWTAWALHTKRIYNQLRSSKRQLWPRTWSNWNTEPLHLREKKQHSHEMWGRHSTQKQLARCFWSWFSAM